MDTSLIAGVTGIIAWIVCIRRGPERAFLNVYLPTLLLLPDSYHWTITGHLGFNQTAIIPIGVYLLSRSWREWQWSFCDLLVLVYVALSVGSQYVNVSYWDAQNVALGSICNVVLPYAVAKLVLADENQYGEAAKRIVVCLTVAAVVGIYEFRMQRNPFDMVLMPFFPGQFSALYQNRFGYLRPAGPYGHAITAAIVFTIGYRMSRWLTWARQRTKNGALLSTRSTRFCQVWLVFGALLTLSRGPWLAAAIAGIVVWLGRARNRKRAIVVFTLFILLVGIPAFQTAKSYVWIERSQAGESGSMEETAAYRHELLEKYVAIVEERPVWGWGRLGWPAIDGLHSVDNQYLLLALTYGEYALAVFVLMLLWMMIRLIAFCSEHDSSTFQGSVALTSLGCIILVALSITTTALLWQAGQLLFLCIGTGEAITTRKSHQIVGVVEECSMRLRFSRIMV